jgi:hypothetical protein
MLNSPSSPQQRGGGWGNLAQGPGYSGEISRSRGKRKMVAQDVTGFCINEKMRVPYSPRRGEIAL